jgi:AcrR family transcriptional regulator
MMKIDTETRQRQIIQISLEIIKKGGIQKLTMKEIARHVDISEQAIYRHFENKSAILTAIIQYFNEHFEDIFNQIREIESAIGRIRRMIEIHLEYFDRSPATAAVIFSEEIFQNESSLAREVRKLVKKRIDFVTKIIQMGQKAGEIKKTYSAEDLAYIILGTLRFLVMDWRLSSFSFSLKERGKSLSKNLIELLRNELPRRRAAG